MGAKEDAEALKAALRAAELVRRGETARAEAAAAEMVEARRIQLEARAREGK